MANRKKYLTSKEIVANLDEIIKRDDFHFYIKGLTRDTRDLLSNLINGLLERIGANPLATFHLFSGLVEALLNALKGNLRYIVYKKELALKLSDVEPSKEDIDHLISVILDTSALREAMQRYILPDKVKRMVQTILSLEEKIRVKKVELSERDQALLFSIRERMKLDNCKISMKIRLDEKELYIRIKNDSPVMDEDMDRIEESRRKHYKLFQEGRSFEFFRPEHLDEKESAGFGIAMIDEGFYNMGLNPLEYFTYTTGSHVTTVYMSYPLEQLRKMEEF
ncbi:MAG: hypothetical protein H7A23_18190 [Leptospiraceae bacterium]|nr:hypothetical protein [Leptospiraceae bacterium]MCP5496480.1 hypothetical protein [Leptospiraceae bacterium]